MRRSTALQWTMHGLPVYAYHFVDPNAAAATIGFPLPFAGVLHGGEVAYLFNDAGLPFPSSEVLSRQMQDYWLSFVVSLNPNDSRGSGSMFTSLYLDYYHITHDFFRTQLAGVQPALTGM